MKDLDYAWAAGFFDGEGCVYIDRRKSAGMRAESHSLHLSVGQKVKQPLELLVRLFGGSIRQDTLIYRWHVSGPTAANALRFMLPYLTLKKPQAELGLLFQSQKHQGNNTLTEVQLQSRNEAFDQMKVMKRGSI